VGHAALGLVLIAVTLGSCAFPASEVPPAGPAPSVATAVDGFARVGVGSVNALVPTGWRALPAETEAGHGFVASPRPRAFGEERGVAGLSATWVDATRLHLPSDYYYLAATGPVLAGLLGSETCRTLDRHVWVDRAPRFVAGSDRSPGDYAASGWGVCRAPGGVRTRWAYFVAAPGFGPAREVGIPASGLYLVVAMAPTGRGARRLVHHLVEHTTFGDASVADLVRTLRAQGRTA
jgi:hypothetical protein